MVYTVVVITNLLNKAEILLGEKNNPTCICIPEKPAP